MSYYRIQSPTQDTADLLDPAQQTSTSYCTDTTRQGVSVCSSLETLARYLADTGIPFDTSWIVVEVEGPRSVEQDEDHTMGALLIHPTEIVSVAPITDQLLDMIDAAWDEYEAA